MTIQSARVGAFRKLHEAGCFAIPNPWDRGTAVVLEQFGFRALASSSAGFAFSQGLPDSGLALRRDAVLAHLRDLVEVTRVPINADFQSGYGADPDGVAESVRLCVETGVAGLSIEDATGDPSRPLFDLDVAVARLAAARRAIDATGSGVLLTARAECFLVGHSDPLSESIRRLEAYAAAGADVLFAPGLPNRSAIEAVVRAAGSTPVNVLIGRDIGLSLQDLGALGVRRVSVGAALARAAWTAFARAARAIAERGEFSGLEGILTTSEVSAWFTRTASLS
jgi:2-methylisocitrate lyase-like PEP mutase family enzyme